MLFSVLQLNITCLFSTFNLKPEQEFIHLKLLVYTPISRTMQWFLTLSGLFPLVQPVFPLSVEYGLFSSFEAAILTPCLLVRWQNISFQILLLILTEALTNLALFAQGNPNPAGIQLTTPYSIPCNIIPISPQPQIFLNSSIWLPLLQHP